LDVAASLVTGCAGFGVNPGGDLVWAIGLPFLGNRKAMIQRRLSVLGFSGFFMLVLHLNNLFWVGSGQGLDSNGDVLPARLPCP